MLMFCLGADLAAAFRLDEPCFGSSLFFNPELQPVPQEVEEVITRIRQDLA